MAQEAITIKEMLLTHFAPGTKEQATMKSTSDLFRILDEHAPGKFFAHELYDVLRENGFSDILVGDVLMWQVAPR